MISIRYYNSQGVVMHEALLYEKLPGSRVRCKTCQWYCAINDNQYGVCRMYHNQGGTLFNMNYAQASSMAADPIEKKPLFHFHRGRHTAGNDDPKRSCFVSLLFERGQHGFQCGVTDRDKKMYTSVFYLLEHVFRIITPAARQDNSTTKPQ